MFFSSGPKASMSDKELSLLPWLCSVLSLLSADLTERVTLQEQLDL